jgi:hypothetical protein
MTSDYPWLSLSTIAKYEPEMKRLGVSEVARSPRGFLTAYKRVGGDWRKLSPDWIKERNAFVARFLAMWREHRTEKIKLALIAWAYMPK